MLSARGRRMLHLKQAVSSTGIKMLAALKQYECDRGGSILFAAVSMIAESSEAMRMLLCAFSLKNSYHKVSHISHHVTLKQGCFSDKHQVVETETFCSRNCTQIRNRCCTLKTDYSRCITESRTTLTMNYQHLISTPVLTNQLCIS